MKDFIEDFLPAAIMIILVILVIGACIFGWISNIILLAYHHTDMVMVILRIIGIIAAPLGVVLGYINV